MFTLKAPHDLAPSTFPEARFPYIIAGIADKLGQRSQRLYGKQTNVEASDHQTRAYYQLKGRSLLIRTLLKTLVLIRGIRLRMVKNGKANLIEILPWENVSLLCTRVCIIYFI